MIIPKVKRTDAGIFHILSLLYLLFPFDIHIHKYTVVHMDGPSSAEASIGSNGSSLERVKWFPKVAKCIDILLPTYIELKYPHNYLPT